MPSRVVVHTAEPLLGPPEISWKKGAGSISYFPWTPSSSSLRGMSVPGWEPCDATTQKTAKQQLERSNTEKPVKRPISQKLTTSRRVTLARLNQLIIIFLAAAATGPMLSRFPACSAMRRQRTEARICDAHKKNTKTGMNITKKLVIDADGFLSNQVQESL